MARGCAKTIWTAALVAAGATGATPAGAQSLHDRFWLEVAGYHPSVDTEATLSSTTQHTVGTAIDFESDLNLNDRKTLPAVFAGARLGSGFSLGAEYYSLSREGGAHLARDITFRDVTYHASADVHTSFDTDIYRLTVGYAFVRRPTYEIGGALGLHVTNVTASISGQGQIGNNSAQLEQRREHFLAPLPTLGLFGTVEAARRLTFSARADYLSLGIDKYHGRLLNMQAAVVYRFLKNAGLGLAYRYVDYRVDVKEKDARGRFSYKFSGPALFLQFGF